MNSAATTHKIVTDRETEIRRIEFRIPGQKKRVYSQLTDSRIEEIIDGKIWTKTEQDAVSLAAEMQAFGSPARALGFAVVFWG